MIQRTILNFYKFLNFKTLAQIVCTSTRRIVYTYCKSTVKVGKPRTTRLRLVTEDEAWIGVKRRSNLSSCTLESNKDPNGNSNQNHSSSTTTTRTTPLGIEFVSEISLSNQIVTRHRIQGPVCPLSGHLGTGCGYGPDECTGPVSPRPSLQVPHSSPSPNSETTLLRGDTCPDPWDSDSQSRTLRPVVHQRPVSNTPETYPSRCSGESMHEDLCLRSTNHFKIIPSTHLTPKNFNFKIFTTLGFISLHVLII